MLWPECHRSGYCLATILRPDVQISVHRDESQVAIGTVNNDHRTEEEALVKNEL